MDCDRFLVRLGENLRRARHRRGITLEQATAGRGGYRYLWQVEAGEKNPSVAMLFRLAKVYGVSVADITDVPGFRHQGLGLAEMKSEPPKRGRPKKQAASKKPKQRSATKKRAKKR